MLNSASPDFTCNIKRTGFLTYRLAASQMIPLSRECVFAFFKNPANLCDITPPWLGFCMVNSDRVIAVHENAEFDYTIRWLGMKMSWRSRIIDYQPPERFTDIQIRGPYRSWCHTHTFEEAEGGTLMEDSVTYKIPLIAFMVHRLLIMKHLEDIFRFRASRFSAWARSLEKLP